MNYSLADRSWQVPKFRHDELKKKHSEYCVCVFVINEGQKIQKQLSAMKRFSEDYDIIIADGGSTDGSMELSRLKELGVRTLLTRLSPGKLSAQMRMALAYAMTEGYAGVIVVDGNNKDDISAIPDFAQKLREGYDHVQGSRFVPGGKAINTPRSRLLGVHLLHAPLISLAARFRYTDTTNGFRAYSSKMLKDQRLEVFRDVFMGYELHYYLAIRAANLGFRVIEIPVTRAYPSSGPVPSKISPVKGNLIVLKTLFKAVVGAYDPPKEDRR